MAKNRKLGRTSDIRKSMLRSLATEVIMYGKLETTETHRFSLIVKDPRVFFLLLCLTKSSNNNRMFRSS